MLLTPRYSLMHVFLPACLHAFHTPPKSDKKKPGRPGKAVKQPGMAQSGFQNGAQTVCTRSTEIGVVQQCFCGSASDKLCSMLAAP